MANRKFQASMALLGFCGGAAVMMIWTSPADWVHPWHGLLLGGVIGAWVMWVTVR